MQWKGLKVIEHKKWTDTLFSLKVERDGRDFIAGQFTKLAFKDPNTDEIISRAYSYVNAPNDDFLEFYYVLVANGKSSQYLELLKIGDEVLVSIQSNGFMTLNELPTDKIFTDMWLLATGTAIGPFISILRDQQAQKRFSHITLVHAVRQSKELAYKDTVLEIQNKYPNLKYIAFISQEENPAMNGIPHLQGRIPNAINTGKLEDCAKRKLDPLCAQIMICGNPAMITDTTQELIKLGFKKNRRSAPGNITTEQYWNQK